MSVTDLVPLLSGFPTELVDARALIGRGDAIELLRKLPDRTFQVSVTDPPYGLSDHTPIDIVECLLAWMVSREYRPGKRRGFMGHDWDAWVPGPELWREVLRVLRPGANLLCFGGTRTFDLMSIACRLGGFELLDTVSWLRGSNVPKGKNVEREIAKTIDAARAQDWAGYRTRLKQVVEPILVFRRPLEGTVVENIVEHGAGALNVDAARVTGGRFPANGVLSHLEGCVRTGTRIVKGDARDTGAPLGGSRPGGFGGVGGANGDPRPSGRVYGNEEVETWSCAPECPVAELDAQSGVLKSGSRKPGTYSGMGYGGIGPVEMPEVIGDVGTASRFFYCAKASSRERSLGLPGGMRNKHPTVKPVELMRWLVRLASPKGALLLDPLCGSGTTLIAAAIEGFESLGIDGDEKTVEVARHRVAAWRAYAELHR